MAKFNLKDLGLQLKKDRRYQAGAAVLAVFTLFALFHEPSRPHGGGVKLAKGTKPLTAGTGSVGYKEAAEDIMTAVRTDLENLKQESVENRKVIEETRKDMQNNVERTSEVFKEILKRMQESETASRQQALDVASANATPEDIDGGIGAGGQQLAQFDRQQGIEQFGTQEVKAVIPPAPPKQSKVAVVGAGDSVRVKLLSGVNAPTDGTPYPVVFKLISDVHGPDGSALPLGEARLIAAAQGSLTDSRALFRLTSLNISYPDGRRNVLEVDGWVVGEDGLRGMDGILIDPIGKAIAGAAMAGGVEGLGEALAARNTTSTTNVLGGQTIAITGSEGEFAAGKGASSAAKVWSRLIEQRVNKLVPQVQVLSGREATAIFARSFRIPGLIEAYQADEDSYSSVD